MKRSDYYQEAKKLSDKDTPLRLNWPKGSKEEWQAEAERLKKHWKKEVEKANESWRIYKKKLKTDYRPKSPKNSSRSSKKWIKRSESIIINCSCGKQFKGNKRDIEKVHELHLKYHGCAFVDCKYVVRNVDHITGKIIN